MSATPLHGAAPVAVAHEPAWVRHGSARTQQDYRAAVAFETALLEQLTHAMTEAAGAGEDGQEGEEGSSTATPGPIASLLPQALAAGVARGGGLGLAAEITRAEQGLRPRDGLSGGAPAVDGATQAPGTGPQAGGLAAPAAEGAS